MTTDQQCLAQYTAKQYQKYLDAKEAYRVKPSANGKALTMAEWNDYIDMCQDLSRSLLKEPQA